MLLRRFACSACTCSCTSLRLEKTRLADTDADIGIEMTVGTLVACGNVDQALSLGFGLARARGQQDCLQHQERLLSSGRNSSDGPRFYTRKRGSGEVLCRASGRHPNHPSSLRSSDSLKKHTLGSGRRHVLDGFTVTRLLFQALSRNSDVLISEKLAVTQLHVSRTLRTIWPSLRRMCCSIQRSRRRAHRWSMAASFPLLSGEH